MPESEVKLMEEKLKMGTIKTQVSEFTINDGNVAFIIKKALKEKGYDIEAKPLQNNVAGWFIGEELKVFRIE